MKYISIYFDIIKPPDTIMKTHTKVDIKIKYLSPYMKKVLSVDKFCTTSSIFSNFS